MLVGCEIHKIFPVLKSDNEPIGLQFSECADGSHFKYVLSKYIRVIPQRAHIFIW
jgi:hypothetical protein